MDKKEFNDLLKRANLSKKGFADLLGVLPSSVNNWGSSQNIPYWVEPFLASHIKAKKYDEIKAIFDEVESKED